MKGRKGSVDEGGIRSPCFIRATGRLPAGKRVPQIAGAIDLLPTIADLCGVPVPGDRPLDGVSLKPLLTGGNDAAARWADRMLFSHWGGRVSVRTQRYRLDDAGHLFDLRDDPSQRRDVAVDNQDVALRLLDEQKRWKREMLAGLQRDDRPFPVGHRQFPVTHLPARDGVPHGNVKRSAPAPNCSFFQNWTSTDDSITWDIEVATAGTYEAVVLYTCPRADVGSTVELSFNGSRVSAKVSVPHDPPLAGAENDRVPRQGESYVKDFKPLRLGEVGLQGGRGSLTLRALDVPGRQVMDVRAMVLTLTE